MESEQRERERERDEGGTSACPCFVPVTTISVMLLSSQVMLACIACTKHGLDEGGDDAATNSAGGKEAGKSLTSQIKDMVLKVSGSRRRRRHYFDDEEMIAVARGRHRRGVLRVASSSSTPAWDMSYEEARSSARWTGGVDAVTAALEDVVLEDEGRPKEWVAQVEPGVHITFVSLPGGAGNDLRRIRFSREMFNKWQAQRWWGENYDRIMELYNVQRFNRQALSPPPRSDGGGGGGGERESFYSRVGSTRESPAATRYTNRPPPMKGVCYPFVPDPSEQFFPPPHLQYGAGVSGAKAETSSMDASRTTTSSRDEASISISNASDLEISEWVEEDEPGVFITIRELADGTRDLRRVRFSREKFGEVHAKLWWEENRERIQTQYL